MRSPDVSKERPAPTNRGKAGCPAIFSKADFCSTSADHNTLSIVSRDNALHCEAAKELYPSALDHRLWTIGFGPHVVGRFTAVGEPIENKKERRGKGGSVETGENPKQVSSFSHTPLEISQGRRGSHFPTAPATPVPALPSKETKTGGSRRPKPKPDILTC
jgi:hypothetical protein